MPGPFDGEFQQIQDNFEIPEGKGVPKIGEIYSFTGYVGNIRVEEKGFTSSKGENKAVQTIERKSNIVVTFLENPDDNEPSLTARFFYSDLEGEELAMKLTSIATLKDALVHHNKVIVWMKFGIQELSGIFTGGQSHICLYSEIKSVEIIAS
jgi:hypothetical protein